MIFTDEMWCNSCDSFTNHFLIEDTEEGAPIVIDECTRCNSSVILDGEWN